jgi:cytochrome b561
VNAEETSRYSPGLRRLHWSMAVLLALVYLLATQRGLFERGTPGRAAMLQSHFWLGIVVFGLAAWRLVLRFRDGVPPVTPPLPAWQALPAKLVHAALYVILFFAMPVLGVAAMWADGKELLVPFTGIAIPPLLGADAAFAHLLEEWHEEVGEALYWVIGLHVAAALYHHYVRRDDSLRHMLPPERGA